VLTRAVVLAAVVGFCVLTGEVAVETCVVPAEVAVVPAGVVPSLNQPCGERRFRLRLTVIKLLHCESCSALA
jgi:hypothetical protein